MPRGKVIKEPSADKTKTGQNDSPETDMNENKNASKFKLVESEAGADADKEESGFPEAFSEKPEHTPMNFKFTLLLVAVFVAVNIGLIALLDKDRPEETTAARHGNAAAKNEATPVKEAAKENTPAKESAVKGNARNEPQNAPAKAAEAKPAAPAVAEKPQFRKAEPEKPVLGAPTATVAAPAPAQKETVTEKPVAAKPIAANPAPAKLQSAHPVATQDLLSIISKD